MKPIHLNSILKKIDNINEFLDYIESSIIQGKSHVIISSKSPVVLGPKRIKFLLDQWYPGYTELAAKERRLYILNQYPLIKFEKSAITRHYDPNHEVFKHFTKTNAMNYTGQKFNAIRRKIDFKFDFITWIVWWISTGKFDQRGVYNDSYQMCRKDDVGPYAWENVYCDTGKNNKQEYWDRNAKV